jgi:hypothetical protein
LEILLDLSKSSIRRYQSGERETPQETAEKLHFLALIIGDLRAGYNGYGIRRWFVRPRSFLNDKSVTQALGKNWNPDTKIAKLIRKDAEWVAGAA